MIDGEVAGRIGPGIGGGGLIVDASEEPMVVTGGSDGRCAGTPTARVFTLPVRYSPMI